MKSGQQCQKHPRRSPLSPRRRGIEHATIESDEMSTSAERQPALVDRGLLRTCCVDRCANAGGRHAATIP